MEIRNVGNRIMNTWIYPIENGWAMIDTGYENSYPEFERGDIYAAFFERSGRYRIIHNCCSRNYAACAEMLHDPG